MNEKPNFVPVDTTSASDPVKQPEKEGVVEPVQQEQTTQATAPIDEQAQKAEIAQINVAEKTLNSLTFDERLGIGIEIANCFVQLQMENLDFVKALVAIQSKFAILSNFREEGFFTFLSTVNKYTPDQRNNFFAAYVLFYVITAGKYPHELWKDANVKLEDTAIGAINKSSKELADVISRAGGAKLADEIRDVAKNFQRQSECADVSLIVDAEDSVGVAKISELLWEVFVTKYGNFRPVFWKNKLGEFYGKKYAIREACEFKQQRSDVDIYAVSYEGKLNKPLHYVCEDCSFVTYFDDYTWLAISADGVGSCAHSYVGSQLATVTLSDTIIAYLQNHHLLTSDKKRRGINGKLKAVDVEDWANFMYYLRFGLATEFYGKWEAAVKMSDVFKNDPNADVVQFTSTLQFAFGCEAFVACARLGDGTYFVRKKERNGNGYSYGGALLNDCISDVTQSSVLTIAHLKGNPSALLVDFFRTDELADIIISSDGVSGFLGESVEDLSKIAVNLRALPFEQRCERLSRIARLSSDYNETQCGSGDDSTLVHICFKD